jgi:hypothetical protein
MLRSKRAKKKTSCALCSTLNGLEKKTCSTPPKKPNKNQKRLSTFFGQSLLGQADPTILVQIFHNIMDYYDIDDILKTEEVRL